MLPHGKTKNTAVHTKILTPRCSSIWGISKVATTRRAPKFMISLSAVSFSPDSLQSPRQENTYREISIYYYHIKKDLSKGHYQQILSGRAAL